MKALNESEALAKLLRLAGNEFGNHGCNDFTLENTDENWEMWKAACLRSSGEFDEPRPPLDRPIYADDFVLMYYFAHRAEEGTL